MSEARYFFEVTGKPSHEGYTSSSRFKIALDSIHSVTEYGGTQSVITLTSVSNGSNSIILTDESYDEIMGKMDYAALDNMGRHRHDITKGTRILE